MDNEAVPDSARLAAIVTVRELAAAGASAVAVRRLLRRGALVALGRGVYAPAPRAAREAASPPGKHALETAARLAACGPGIVASHRSAAIIHGLDLLGPVPQRVELTRAPGTGSKTVGGVNLRVAALPPWQVTVHRGVPVTSAARTVVDLARVLSFPAAVVTADSSLRGNLTSRQQLESVVASCGRWQHIRQASRVAGFADGRSESVLESLARVTFSAYGLPAPELQVWVGNDYEIISRVDFLWAAFRTIAEADGKVKYASPFRALEQLQRDARLRDAGFEVVHFTWNDIVRMPEQVVTSLKRAFHRGVGLRNLPPPHVSRAR